VQEILGHSNINITLNVYSHVLPTMQEDAMERLNESLLWQEPEELLEEEQEEEQNDDKEERK
jgi:integrase